MSGRAGKSPLDWFHQHYVDREHPARSARAAGRKVVGYLANTVPVELIVAAGAFPVRIFGEPSRETEIGDRAMEEIFDGSIRSVFDRALRGEFAFLDLLVIPRSSEGLLQLYYYLLEMRRRGAALPDIYLFDLLQTPNWTTGRYVHGRLIDLQRRLESLAGRPVTASDLNAAIASENAVRKALLDVNARRRDGRISGTDMLRVIASSSLSDRAETLAMLRAIATERPSTASPRPRLMVKGSPQEDDRLYALVESCGAIVVADDHSCGETTFRHLVLERDEPIEALTDYYQRHAPGPRSYPQVEVDKGFAVLVAEAKVEGVIFYLEENDDTLGWDLPAQRSILDMAGIPWKVLTKQSYRTPDAAAQRKAVQELVEEIARRRPWAAPKIAEEAKA